MLFSVLPFILLIGAMAWMGRQTLKSQSGIFNFGRSKARKYNGELPGVTFEDVAGADEAKEELSEVVEFLRNPQKYHDIGARIPRGVLLVGPPRHRQNPARARCSGRSTGTILHNQRF